jgi:hypothetical protein
VTGPQGLPEPVRGLSEHSERILPPLTVKGAITVGLARYRQQVAQVGWCADGPDCVWCPAEIIYDVIRTRTKIDPNL